MIQSWEEDLIDRPDDCATVQRNCNGLEQQANRNLMQFSNRKCQVLHLEMNKSMHQYMLGANQLQDLSSFAEKDLRVPVDNKLNMSQCCASAVKKGNSTLGGIRQRALPAD